MVLQSPQTPSAEQIEEGPLFGEAIGSEAGIQAFLSEISEEDVEVLRQREEALLQIEVRTLTSVRPCTCIFIHFTSFEKLNSPYAKITQLSSTFTNENHCRVVW